MLIKSSSILRKLQHKKNYFQNFENVAKILQKFEKFNQILQIIFLQSGKFLCYISGSTILNFYLKFQLNYNILKISQFLVFTKKNIHTFIEQLNKAPTKSFDI